MFDKLRFRYRAWKYKFRDDKLEINYLCTHITPGAKVVDIGAHKGGYLYWLRKAVGVNGKVFCFEPQPILFRYLSRIINLLDYRNVSLEWMGLSDQPGRLKLVIPAAEGATSPGASFAVTPQSGNAQHSVEVKVDTLDHYFSGSANRPITFIKCDVEGHELAVFRGGQKLLQEDMPTLLFECEARHMNSGSIEEVFSFLQGFGYHGYFFCEGSLLPLSQFEIDKHQQTCNGQIVNHLTYCNNFLFSSTPVVYPKA